MVNKKLEEFKKFINQKKVAVIGLGVSNTPLLGWLYNNHALVSIFDKREKEALDKDSLVKVEQYGMQIYNGENYLDNLKGFDIIFRSPSCRPDLEQIEAEAARGAIVTSEIEMLLELCPGKVIGVTGSDGKTTTTSLIYEMIKAKGYSCYLGGNIGIPLFAKIDEMKKDDIVVLELSSFQLMNMKVSPEIAVITNITPNHLDIHKSYNEYIEAKKNIFKNQDENGFVVLNYDNELTRECAKEVPGKFVYFSKTKLDNGYILDNNTLKRCENSTRRHIVDTKDIILRGTHNYENILAALAATQGLVDIDTQIKVITTFKGVEHRLELVRQLYGVKWYNDSIGTSPTRTIAGLNSFSEKIVLIAGGYDKHLDYEPLAKPIVDNVSKLILLGQTAEKINNCVKRELEASNKELPIYRVLSLEEAVKVAKEVAEDGEIVLLSPASAAFDMFKNFAERGKIYKELVNNL